MTQRPITLEDKLKEVERELKFRHFVYKGQVERGKLTRELAQRRIQIMTSIADDYREKLAEGPLFRHADGGKAAKL